MASGNVKCPDCDALFDPSPSGKGPRRERCDQHRALRKAQLQRARTAQLRAESYGVLADLVIAHEVFERDNWVCHVCGEPVPEHLRKSVFRAGESEPLVPEVDHVIPLSKGGPHTMDNCATAHHRCNRRKSAGEGVPIEPEPEQPKGVREHTVGVCSIEGCPAQKVFAKGLCQNHYNRNRKYGHPLKMLCGCGCGEIVEVDAAWTGLLYIDGHGIQYGATEPAEKLRKKLVAQPVSDRGREQYGLTDDCLIWTGTTNKRGYGAINFRVSKGNTRVEMAHRFAYALVHGSVANDLTIDHLCGVPLCCNPNHLEAVSLAENVSRSALAITSCPQGHAYDEKNTLYAGENGYRVCRQCNRNRSHTRDFGHDFVPDPENTSSKRESCLTCRLEAESTPQFCPHRHEYTDENTRRDDRGNRYCIQCGLNRRHVEQFGHEFVIDESNPSEKRKRCLVCVEAAAPVTHCLHGHEYTELTLEFSRKGHRKCVQCRLDAAHIPAFGHSYSIDPSYTPGSKRRCTVCEQKQQAELPTHCVNGHEFTALTKEFHSTRGNRVCVQCRLDATHLPKYGHSFDIDPDNTGKLRRCLICRSGGNRDPSTAIS